MKETGVEDLDEVYKRIEDVMNQLIDLKGTMAEGSQVQAVADNEVITINLTILQALLDACSFGAKVSDFKGAMKALKKELKHTEVAGVFISVSISWINPGGSVQ